MVRSTSREAYESILTKLGERQRAVLTILKEGKPLTNRELAQRLGLEINQVTPRCKELREVGLVKEVGEKRDPETRRMATLWAVKDYLAPAPPRIEYVEINGVMHARLVEASRTEQPTEV